LDQALNDKTLDQKSLVHYVPHGVNPETFRPLDRNSPEVSNRRLEILKKDYDIVFFYNNRNITRKRTSNIILGFRTFCDNLPKEKANKCALLLHTQPVDEHGTDLVSVKDALCPHYDVIFSINKVSPQDLNVLYNCADVTVSATSNEGWGIGTTESIMAGVPTIMPVTGGQQDQIGQVDDVGNPLEFNGKWGSNHDGKFKNHGVWVKPIWPAVRTLQGSPLTPYIFDDLIKWEDIAEAMMFWYQIPREKRLKAGLKGREWATSNGLTNVGMCEQMQRSIDATLTNWKPRSRFSLHKPDEFVGNKMFDPNCMGFEIPKISNDSVQFDIRNFEVKLEK
jgi:glycosyltransferase involved in cell wall biosynthesis